MSAQLKILVVDDNRDAADSLALILAGEGYAVRAAYDGRSGIQAADESKPDVVLLDIAMPQMSGYDVVRELRNHKRAPRPTLVAVTAFGQVSDKLAARQAGFDHHLTKPVDLEALFRFLSEQVAKASRPG